MELIHDWLEGSKHYSIGRAIYKSLGSDESLKTMFDSGYSDYNQQRLEKELRAMLSHVKEIEVQDAPEIKVMLPKPTDPILNSIYQEWKPLYMKMNYLRHDLDRYEGQSEVLANIRKPIAIEILELEKKINKLWQDSDYFKEHGHLPNINQPKFKKPDDPVELANAINNCGKNIRRSRKRAELNPSNPDYMQLYIDYKHKYKELTGNDYVEK